MSTNTSNEISRSTPHASGPIAAAHELEAAIAGEIVTPTDPRWDRARQPWDLVDQRPAFVALPRDLDDVREIVVSARAHGLRVAPQGTGHNAAPLGPLEDTILVSTRHMRGIEIDRRRMSARVEAGVVWREVSEATTPHGLFALAGSSPDVGVIGFTLGGGLSWFGRKDGLAANHVTAIEVVTADGRFHRATASDDADLFWALRGGGGNFGIVTAMEIELFPYGEVYAGMYVWPYDRHRDVITAWRRWTRTADEDTTTSLRIMHFPALPELPTFLSGRSVVVIDGAFAGGAPAGRAAVADLGALGPDVDTWDMVSPVELGRLHMDPERPLPVRSTSALLDDLDGPGSESFAAASRPPLTVGELRHLGGALARLPDGAGALGALPGQYLSLGAGVVSDGNEAHLAAALRRFHAALAPHANGTLYHNVAAAPADPRRFYPVEVLDRLRRVRDEFDPEGLLVANHPIAPSR